MLYPDAAQTPLEKLKQSSIFLPNGNLQPITQLADIQIEQGVAEVERENLQPMIPVIARLNNRDLGSVMSDIQSGIKTKLHLPQGYHINYGGAYQEQQKSFSELLLILISAILLVFLVMIFLFKRIRVALLIMFIWYLEWRAAF